MEMQKVIEFPTFPRLQHPRLGAVRRKSDQRIMGPHEPGQLAGQGFKTQAGATQ